MTDFTPQEQAIVPADNTRLAPSQRKLTFTDIVQQVMNEAQYSILAGSTPPYAIKYKEKGGRAMPYVPHGYVRDQLNKAFGFDWDFEMQSAFNQSPFHLAEFVEGGKKFPNVTVLGRLTIRIRNPNDMTQVITTIVKEEFGSQAQRSGMEFGDALKGAASDALKRCGLGLGIALDLYYNDETEERRYRERQAATQAAMQAEQERIAKLPPATLPDLLLRANQRWGKTMVSLEEDFPGFVSKPVADLWGELEAKYG